MLPLNLTSQNNSEGPSLHSTVLSSWKALIKYLGAGITYRKTDTHGSREVSRLESSGIELDQ